MRAPDEGYRVTQHEGEGTNAAQLRPGAGWKHIAGAVYEHANGTRVHLLGTIRLPNGEFVSAHKWPESKDAGRFVRINGGNWKRGLMAWAAQLTRKR